MVEVALVRGKLLGLGAVLEPVAHADGNLSELGEHVELRKRERRHTVHPNGEPKRHEIEPATPALAPGHRAELVTE